MLYIGFNYSKINFACHTSSYDKNQWEVRNRLIIVLNQSVNSGINYWYRSTHTFSRLLLQFTLICNTKNT